ncbi:hypothetical protein P4T90_12580 [Heyndrickxia acidicola]|uniref:Membrane transporter protein n=2 Tax=Heyndrickxia acidicola TaxID=209389 RepID=A0ABU6MGS9_9BACI|nr:hypothetical protein [Heyndrickxia acidicola]MED1203890.1 hypothetical protein [Heyndrickxia acidicola]
MTASEMVGTDITHAFLLVTPTGLLPITYANVNYLLIGNLSVGSIPGVIIRSKISAKFPARPLKGFVAILIILSGIKLL